MIATPVACATFTKADAVSWIGAPLGAVRKSDEAARSPDGRPRLSTCMCFPNGFDLATAEHPPERGLYVTLMAMPDIGAARERFDDMTTGVPGTPAFDRTLVRGIGEEAVLERVKLQPSGSQMVRLKFRHGDVAGSVQVWAKARDAAAVARTVAAHIVSRLR
ncbi:MAG: hypothetical protein K8R60_08240 [Burkholderiales bacterium]|nr:hypothetical protein [Burkholderiales bacterium]